MQPARIIPDLQASLICEEVRQEITGNFILIGILGLVRVPHVPITALKLCVFNRWTAGVGSFTENVRLLAPDQTTLMRKSEVKFALQDPSHHATNVTVFGQVEFAAAGLYYVEVLVEDIMKLRFPLAVAITTPASPPPGPSPNPTA